MVINNLPNNLSIRQLPKLSDHERFSENFMGLQEACHEIFDSETNKTWGFVSIDNTRRGPGLGGIRIAPDITLNEVNRLAKTMTLKNSASCLPYGGGKAGLIVNDPTFYKDRTHKKILIKKFSEILFDLNNYIPAADMGTDEYDIQTIYEHHSRKLQQDIHDRGGVGRPFDSGGVPLDDWGLTAHGISAAAQTLESLLDNFNIKNSKVIIQGFGNVGCPTAMKLNQKGALIVGASDIYCALWNPKGLDLKELVRIRKLPDGLKNYSKKVNKIFENKKLDWLLEAPCDILVPAARPDVVTAKNIDRIDCRLILEGANTPISKPIDYYLKHRRNILSLTDFIVNAGGVIGCAVEQKIMKDKAFAAKVRKTNTRQYTENLIFNTISKNIIEIFSRIRKDYLFRDAATELALERLETKEIWL
tara:strand:- start:198 stop:1451 length:1254 start_codon:yes stop_codon:yes gene_type:complete